MRILITGGHITPALTFIDYLRKHHSDIKILFAGRKHYYVEKETTLEYQEITARKIEFIPFETGRFSRTLSLQLLSDLGKTIKGFFQAKKIINRYKPDVILSFGSYMAVPMIIAASLDHISIYTHEQTIHPGLANRLIGIFAKKIFISFPQAKKFFSDRKVVLLDPLIREQVLKVIEKPFILIKKKPVIYITGGSLGAHRINLLVEPIVKDLVNSYIVIHQIGNIQKYKDFETCIEIKNKLPEHLKKDYYPVTHFSSDEIGYVYSMADLVISRSGANTYAEVFHLRKPALFIPLPESAYQEQLQHATIYQKEQHGEIFDQDQSSEQLLVVINKIMNTINNYRHSFDKLPVSTSDACSIIFQTISKKA